MNTTKKYMCEWVEDEVIWNDNEVKKKQYQIYLSMAEQGCGNELWKYIHCAALAINKHELSVLFTPVPDEISSELCRAYSVSFSWDPPLCF